MYGGGSAEIACSLAIEEEAERVAGVDQYSMQGFADALESIPLALAENSGLPSIESLTEVSPLPCPPASLQSHSCTRQTSKYYGSRSRSAEMEQIIYRA